MKFEVNKEFVGHLSLLTFFNVVGMIYSLFYGQYSPCTVLYVGGQLLFKRKHRSGCANSRPRVSKAWRLKLKREVARKKKAFKIEIIFSGRRRRSREEGNGFVRAHVK